METGAAEAFHQHVAAALINLAHFLDAIVGPLSAAIAATWIGVKAP